MQLSHARYGRHVPRHASNPELLERWGASRRQIAGALLVGALVTATSTPAYASSEHKVQPGDSLWALAKANGVSVAAIAEANGLLNPDLIKIGTIIVIPDPEGSGADPDVHIVVPGDTLWGIAAHYGIGLGQLARQNGLAGSDPVIHPGQELVITPGAGDTTPSDSATGAGAVVSAPRTYVVVAGDTLWAIGDRLGVPVADLLSANGLTEAQPILVGQRLVVPTATVNLANLPADLAADPGRLALVPVFDHWAAEYGVPADLLKSLAWFESGWNNTKVSSAEAIGIGQILPITADFVSEHLIGATLDPFVASDNIQISARYLRYLLDNTGDPRLAVASYYQGLTATRQHGIYRSSQFYVDGILSLRSRFG